MQYDTLSKEVGDMADNYTVLTQKQSTVINPTGNGFLNVWEITYKVTSGPSRGTTALVEVPEDEHDAVHVKQAIEDKIAQLDAVAGL